MKHSKKIEKKARAEAGRELLRRLRNLEKLGGRVSSQEKHWWTSTINEVCGLEKP